VIPIHARNDSLTPSQLGQHGSNSSDAPSLTEGELNLEALFAIQAGAETTPGALTLMLYYIIRNRNVYNRLTAELADHFPDGVIVSDVLYKLPYLSAVVNEGLRLGTPFPGLPRVVPKGGAVLAGTYVPGGTIVGVPPYAQQVSPENFWPSPKEFIPERWLPEEFGKEATTRKSAILCFSAGRH
jgi:cytochrome P450